jgi:hypothetical protein
VSRFAYTVPERLQFREGGGCLSVFGIPFFAAGLFLLATAGGAIPMGDPGDLGRWGRPLLGLMGLVFTGVGGTLVFGRAWSILDVSERAAIKSWGLLVPFREQRHHLDGYSRVTIGFEAGDSDSSDKFPVLLKARSGPDFVVCSPAAYEEARACAAEAARHVGFTLEDASGDRATRLDPTDVDRPLIERAREARGASLVAPPQALRSEVHHETTGLRIVIPHRPLSRLGLVFAVVPVLIPIVVVPWLWNFFQQTQTPAGFGLIFLGLFSLMFGVLPAMTIVNGILRAQRGHIEVLASRAGVTVHERGAWRTRALASIDASEILDVNYGTRVSGIATAKHAVEQKMIGAGHEPATLSPRLEGFLTAAARWAKGRGVIIKSRSGLTTFGEDLDDGEIRYLADVVRQALAGRT